MAFYCAACGKEIPGGQEVFAQEAAHVRPRHVHCVAGYREPDDTLAVAGETRVTCVEGRLVCQRLTANGAVDGWLELPASLKQPLMAMVAEVAGGHAQVDFPVPGGDRLVVSLEAVGGSIINLHLRREPTGFPPQGRALSIPGSAIELFLTQCRAV